MYIYTMILVFQIEQNFDDFSKFKIGRPFLRTDKNLLDKRPMGRGGLWMTLVYRVWNTVDSL